MSADRARQWPADAALCLRTVSIERLAGEARVSTFAFSRGWFTDDQADRVAIALGVHPSAIWPEWFNVVLTPEDRAEIAFFILRGSAA